jgi:hypothetical protein
MRAAPGAFAAAALLLACGGRDPSTPADSGAPGAPAGGGTPATPATPQPSDGRSTLTFAIDRTGARADVSRLDLQVLQVAIWVDVGAPPPTNGKPCDLTGAEATSDAAAMRIDLSTGGTTTLARMETSREGELTEVRLFVRGTLQHAGRTYDVNGDELCVGADGQDVAVLRVHPASPLVLQGGRDYRLTMPFAQAELREEHVTCPKNPPPGTWVPHECARPDDPGDDGDPATRIRFQLVGEGTCEVTPK